MKFAEAFQRSKTPVYDYKNILKRSESRLKVDDTPFSLLMQDCSFKDDMG